MTTNLEDHLGQLHHGDWHSETFGGPVPKDQLMGLMHRPELIRVADQPPFGPKHVRIIPKDLIQLCTPCVETNESASGDVMTVDDVASGGDHTLPELAERRKLSQTLEDTSLEVAKLLRLDISNGIPDLLFRDSDLNFGFKRLIHPRVRDDCKQGALNRGGRSVGARHSVTA